MPGKLREFLVAANLVFLRKPTTIRPIAIPQVLYRLAAITAAQDVGDCAAERTFPVEARTAVIHRLELPQGRFERKIPLPPGLYENPQSFASNGCVVIKLPKAAAQRTRP